MHTETWPPSERTKAYYNADDDDLVLFDHKSHEDIKTILIYYKSGRISSLDVLYRRNNEVLSLMQSSYKAYIFDGITHQV